MKKLLLIVLFFSFFAKSQVVIGNQTASHAISNYVGVELLSNTNKGVRLPIVTITDVYNSTKPILNPADGLMLYNYKSSIGTGIYFWKNSKWNSLADSNNMVSYMLLKNTTPYNRLNGVGNGTFVSLLDPNYSVVNNDINAVYSNMAGITLKGNSGYLISVCLNISTTQANEPNSSGMKHGSASIPTSIYLHQYIVRLQDASGKVYGEAVNINAASSATTSNKFHIVNASFTVSNTSSSTITLFPYIAYGNYDSSGNYSVAGSVNGGNYYNLIPAANTGEITINFAKIDIVRGMLNQ